MGLYEKPLANIRFNDERLKSLASGSESEKTCLPLALLVNTGSSIWSNSVTKPIKGIQDVKAGLKLYLKIIQSYIEKMLKNPHKIPIKPINKLSKVARIQDHTEISFISLH